MDRGKPLLLEKTRRGREMKTNEVKGGNEVELYHEGYVGGKKYLVPDSNLEAMRDMVNFKMKRTDDYKYARGSMKKDDKKDYEKYQKKLQDLYNKLTELEEEEDDLKDRSLLESSESETKGISPQKPTKDPVRKNSKTSEGRSRRDPSVSSSDTLTKKKSHTKPKGDSISDSSNTSDVTGEKARPLPSSDKLTKKPLQQKQKDPVMNISNPSEGRSRRDPSVSSSDTLTKKKFRTKPKGDSISNSSNTSDVTGGKARPLSSSDKLTKKPPQQQQKDPVRNIPNTSEGRSRRDLPVSSSNTLTKKKFPKAQKEDSISDTSNTSDETGGKSLPLSSSDKLTNKSPQQHKKDPVRNISKTSEGRSRKDLPVSSSNTLTKKKFPKAQKEDSISDTSNTSDETGKNSLSLSSSETLTKKPPPLTASSSETLTRKTSPEKQKRNSTRESYDTRTYQKIVSPEFETLRFLVSGHFRSDTKPIFIIQQYEGKSPLENKSPDFSSTQTESNVDILMSGKFYQESILEEVNNKPISLRTKPYKIAIDERSRIYEESFVDIVNVGDLAVEFEGKFIHQQATQLYTPLISVGVRKASPEKNDIFTDNTAMVYISRPESQSLFGKRPQKYKVTKGDSCSKHYHTSNDDYSCLNSYPSHSRGSDSADRYNLRATSSVTTNPHRKRSFFNPMSGQSMTENGECSNKSRPSKNPASSFDASQRKSGFFGQATVRKISQALFFR